MSGLEPLLFAVCIAIAGGAFHGFAGFGSGMLMAPLMTLVFPPELAVPVLLIVSFVGSLRMLHQAKGDANPRRVLNLAIPALFTLPIGLLSLELVPAHIFRSAIAIIVLALVVFLASGMSIRGASRPVVLGISGVVSGFLTGVGGVGGPPVVLTLLSVDDPAPNTRANLIAYFTVTGAMAIAILAVTGGLDVTIFTVAAVTAPFFIAANALGGYFFKRSVARSYRGVALGFLALVAIGSLLMG